MIEYQIKEMKTEDIIGKATVHFQAWNETYKNIMPDSYLDNRKIENCILLARRYPENTLVLVVNGKIVGFSCYLENPNNSSVKHSSLINALYILKEYQGKGLGKALLDKTISMVKSKDIILFVLDKNTKAISFYEHYGFIKTGHTITDKLPFGEIIEYEMLLRR